MLKKRIEAYIWLRLTQHQDSKYAKAFNELADTLSLEELFKVDDMYRERKKEIPLPGSHPGIVSHRLGEQA